MGVLVYLIYRGMRPFSITASKYPLPDSFLKLKSDLRRQSLDFAWKEKAFSLPWASMGKQVRSVFLLIFLIVPLLFFVILIGLRELFETNKPDQWGICGICWWLFFYGLALLSLHKYFSLKVLIAIAKEEYKANAQYNEDLRKLGVDFVQSQCQKWITQMDTFAGEKALKESQAKPQSKFTLFSYEFSLFPSEIPKKKLGVTYIFSNSFMVIVADIVFDLKGTSYSYVDSDNPTLHLNSADNWSIREFHYRDIVEVSYKPSDSATDTVKTSGREYPVEGFLFLGLVNGSKEQFPTTKRDASNLLTVVRDKVRLTKAS
jgi:hypothetical protein